MSKKANASRIALIVIVALVGAYFFGHSVQHGSRPLDLEGLKQISSEDERSQLTEADLVVDGKPLLIATKTHYFSLIGMAGGAIAGGLIGWAISISTDKFRRRKTQSVPT